MSTEEPATGTRTIQPAGRRRPGDRIRRIAAFGAGVLLILLVVVLLPDRPGADSEEKETGDRISEISGVGAEAVLQAIQDGVERSLPPVVEQDSPEPDPPPPEEFPIRLEPQTIAPFEPEDGAREAVQRRKGESPILVYVAGGDGAGPEPGEEGPVGAAASDLLSETGLGRRLVPTAARAEEAVELGSLDGRILQGTLISCVLETAISSAVPGLVTCRTRTPVYSANGEYELVPAGSRVTGEYQGGIEDGQARIFVLWNRLVTPDGVAVTLASPGAGPLGRGGHGGWLNRRWGDRVAASLMVSLITDAAADSAEGRLSATREATRAAAAEVIASELAVRSELTKNQGERITIIVARDLDFHRVLERRIWEAGAGANFFLFEE